MNFSKLSLDDILLKGGIVINNSLSDEGIQSAVAAYGYNSEKLTVGQQLLNAADVLNSTQKKEYGELTQAQNIYDLKKIEANKKYVKILRIARVALKNNVQATKTLELEGKRTKAISGWIQQSRNFYDAILANQSWLQRMAVYGQTEEVLSAAQAEVVEVNNLVEAVKKESGEAQNATEVRDAKFDELVDWLGDYIEIATIALEDQSQMLEKLGIVVKN